MGNLLKIVFFIKQAKTATQPEIAERLDISIGEISRLLESALAVPIGSSYCISDTAELLMENGAIAEYAEKEMSD